MGGITATCRALGRNAECDAEDLQLRLAFDLEPHVDLQPVPSAFASEYSRNLAQRILRGTHPDSLAARKRFPSSRGSRGGGDSILMLGGGAR